MGQGQGVRPARGRSHPAARFGRLEPRVRLHQRERVSPLPSMPSEYGADAQARLEKLGDRPARRNARCREFVPFWLPFLPAHRVDGVPALLQCARGVACPPRQCRVRSLRGRSVERRTRHSTVGDRHGGSPSHNTRRPHRRGTRRPPSSTPAGPPPPPFGAPNVFHKCVLQKGGYFRATSF